MSDEIADTKLAFAPDGAAHDVTPAQPLDADCPADDTNDFPDDFAVAAPGPREGLKRAPRAFVMPLFANARALSVIVTALVALTAVTVASEAAKVINATFDPIIAALKRF
jgi:hypothetical protein